MSNQTTLIIGANSAIAKAISSEINKQVNQQLLLVSRDCKQLPKSKNCQSFEIGDYSPGAIEEIVTQLCNKVNQPIDRVIICTGILHSPCITVEKRIEDFEAKAFTQVMQANALTPILFIQALLPLLKSKRPCKVIVFSARVGSISDNRLGGWYSYRASKAALNMMLKTLAIELRRVAKNVKVIAFHPGTTDTPLSKPFQKNVPQGKLFDCDFVAKQLLEVTSNLDVDGEASFVDWQGKSISW